jgi:hypothetical protein
MGCQTKTLGASMNHHFTFGVKAMESSLNFVFKTLPIWWGKLWMMKMRIMRILGLRSTLSDAR